MWGTNGRITADRQECQIYLREPHAGAARHGAGWTVRYTTELTEEVWFYLRGEEYSAQIDYFVQSIEQRRTDGENSFRSALAGRPRGGDDPGRERRRRCGASCAGSRRAGTPRACWPACSAEATLHR